MNGIPEPLIGHAPSSHPTHGPELSIVIPTIGRPSLAGLLDDLRDRPDEVPVEIVIVDDRTDREGDPFPPRCASDPDLHVVAGRSRGPATARNRGWRAATGRWIAFLDDDVRLEPGWFDDLLTDLAEADPAAGAVYGNLTVPRPDDRAPTDDERATIQLEGAGWITADAAFRRSVLEEIGGFDERFPRAYREDSDLVLRLLDAGHVPTVGRRRVRHPLRADGRWSSIRRQLGNADDALLDRIHGPDWRHRIDAGRGRLRRHVATTVAMAATVGALVRRRPRRAVVPALLTTALLLDFHRSRRPEGRRDPVDVASLALTSIAIPPTATLARLSGEIRARRLVPTPRGGHARVVLLDRDGTLVEDVPYNGDPEMVRPVPGAREALDRLRRAGVRLAIVSNQRGLALGSFDEDDLAAVNTRIGELLGPFPVVACCPHDEDDGCGCRKPEPGLVHTAARRLGVDPTDCVMIGDIGADVGAAVAAGAAAILVPTPATRTEEILSAPAVAPDLHRAVDLILGGHR